MKKILTPILVIAVIVAAFFVGKSIGSNSFKNDQASSLAVGHKFVSNATQGNYQQAYDDQGSQKLRDGFTSDEFKELLLDINGKEASEDSGSVYVGVNSAIYIQPVDSSNGQDNKIVNLILEKEAGEWKVLSPSIR